MTRHVRFQPSRLSKPIATVMVVATLPFAACGPTSSNYNPNWAEEDFPSVSSPTIADCMGDPPSSAEVTSTGSEYAQRPRRAYAPTSSSLALDERRGRLVVVDDDGDTLMFLNTAGAVIEHQRTGREPYHVVVDPHSGAAVVSLRLAAALEIHHLGEPTRTIAVGVEPMGMAMLDDGRIAVALAAEAAVVLVDLQTERIVQRIETRPDPSAISIDRRGNLVVAHLQGGKLEQISGIRARGSEHLGQPSIGYWSLRDSFNNVFAANAGWASYLPHPTAIRTLIPSPNGIFAFHTLANPDPVTTTSTGPGSGTDCPYYGCPDPRLPSALETGVTVIDVPNSDGPLSTTTPISGVPDATGGLLVENGRCGCRLVAGLGSESATLECASNIDGQPSPAVTIDVGQGVSGFAATTDGSSLWTWSSFEDRLTQVDLDNVGTMETRGMQYGISSRLTDEQQTGRALFHLAEDSTMSANGQVSCAACHVGGRNDGLTWHFPFGARNTPQLGGGISQTAPFHAAGDVVDFADLSRATIETMMGGVGLNDAQMRALASYVDTLPVARVPPPSDPVASAAIARGAAIFADEEVGCTACHSGEHFTNGATIDVGSGDSGMLTGLGFQVPVLHGLGRTAPYLHDGSVPTLDIFVAEWVARDRMGHGSHLSDHELSDLVAFLKTL